MPVLISCKPPFLARLSVACLCAVFSFQTLAAQPITLPDLGGVARSTLSESHEDRIGREIMRQIRDSGDYYPDPVILEYLARIGERLGSASPEPGKRFEFFAVRDPTLNAFALPGGYIGVHTGLLSATRNESELAGVLGHELGHVTQQHIARMVDAQKTNSLVSILALAVAILAARSNSDVTQAAMTASQAYSIQSQLDFTRENEREADRIGLQTMADAGYSPQGMSSFFERLQFQGRLYENNAPGYLRTHPLTYERIADLENRLSRLPYHQHEDSLEYLFVRARVQAAEGEAADALRRFQAQSQDHPGPGDWYGLTRAALRANQLDKARHALAQLKPLAAKTPLIALLEGEVELAAARPEKAIAVLEPALRQHGGYRPLAYLHAEALLRANRPTEALHYVTSQQKLWSGDVRFHTLSAQAHQALGQPAQAHLAQAEAYALQDRIAAAIDQLQSAQRQKDADFYTQSIVDARLRELRQKQAEEMAR